MLNRHFYREETVSKSAVYWYNVNGFGQSNNLFELVFLPKNMEIVNPFTQNVRLLNEIR